MLLQSIGTDYEEAAEYIKLFLPKGEIDVVVGTSLTEAPYETIDYRGRLQGRCVRETAPGETSIVIDQSRLSSRYVACQLHDLRTHADYAYCMSQGRWTMCADNAARREISRAEILEYIANHTREVLPGLDEHVFVASDRLTDLGANSMDRAEIAMMVQDSLSLAIPRVELFGPKNIGELADLFLSKLRVG